MSEILYCGQESRIKGPLRGYIFYERTDPLSLFSVFIYRMVVVVEKRRRQRLGFESPVDFTTLLRWHISFSFVCAICEIWFCLFRCRFVKTTFSNLFTNPSRFLTFHLNWITLKPYSYSFADVNKKVFFLTTTMTQNPPHTTVFIVLHSIILHPFSVQ